MMDRQKKVSALRAPSATSMTLSAPTGAIRHASCPRHLATRRYCDSFAGLTACREDLVPACYTCNSGRYGGRRCALTKATLHRECKIFGVKLTRGQIDDFTRLGSCADGEVTTAPGSARIPVRAHGEDTSPS